MRILKKITALITAAVVCLCCGFAVSAENAQKVADGAGLLTASEAEQLETKIMEVIKKHSYTCDVVVVTTNSTDGKSAEAYADDYYDYNGCGYGSRYSGVLLLVDMGNRAWHISGCGNGTVTFNSDGIKAMGDQIVPYLSDGDYNGAFDKFVSLADDYITKYETDGVPYDAGYVPKEPSRMLLISVGTGLVVSLIVCLMLRAQLKTAVKQFGAGNYIRSGSMNVRAARDIFLYNEVTKTKIESGSGGGSSGGTHTSSGGRSHSGGGGHF